MARWASGGFSRPAQETFADVRWLSLAGVFVVGARETVDAHARLGPVCLGGGGGGVMGGDRKSEAVVVAGDQMFDDEPIVQPVFDFDPLIGAHDQLALVGDDGFFPVPIGGARAAVGLQIVSANGTTGNVLPVDLKVSILPCDLQGRGIVSVQDGGTQQHDQWADRKNGPLVNA